MVEKSTLVPPATPLVVGDIPDFVSVVDGRVVHGRAGLRRHNKELGVTNPADYTETWDRFARKRADLFQGKDNDPKRTEAIVRAFHKLQGRTW